MKNVHPTPPPTPPRSCTPPPHTHTHTHSPVVQRKDSYTLWEGISFCWSGLPLERTTTFSLLRCLFQSYHFCNIGVWRVKHLYYWLVCNEWISICSVTSEYMYQLSLLTSWENDLSISYKFICAPQHCLIRVCTGHSLGSQRSKASSADIEDSDRPARMRRLIWIFAGSTCVLVGNTVPQLVCKISKVHVSACFSVPGPRTGWKMHMSCTVSYHQSGRGEI